MSENSDYEVGFGSDASKQPQRIVFITRKTSAKVKGDVGRQLMTYPHLLLREAIVFQIFVIALVVIALLWNAPLEELANPLLTPNPAKAPWYFLGLQELLHYFPPLVAGVLIPTLVIIALVVIPYFDVNIEKRPMWTVNRGRRLTAFVATAALLLILFAAFQAWDLAGPTLVIAVLILVGYYAPPGGRPWTEYLRSRPPSWWVMTWFITISVTLTVVGTFFRGPGWSLVWPWR